MKTKTIRLASTFLKDSRHANVAGLRKAFKRLSHKAERRNGRAIALQEALEA